MNALGVVLVTVLVLLAGLHFYWGLGGFWPGHDADSLRLRVVGTPHGQMFGFAACAAVATALLFAAAIVGIGHSTIATGRWRPIVMAGYVALILVFGARGLAPYVSSVFDYSRETPFFELNRRLYAPLCLAIAAGLLFDLGSMLKLPSR